MRASLQSMLQKVHGLSTYFRTGEAANSPAGQTKERHALDRDESFNPVLMKIGNVQNELTSGATLFGDLMLSEGGIRLKCRVDGSIIQSNDSLVIVDQGAEINGLVRARYLLVLGRVTGNIHAERIVIGASARISGDITYERSIGIVTGARIAGKMIETGASADNHAQPGVTLDTAFLPPEVAAPRQGEPTENVLPFPSIDRIIDHELPAERRYATR